MHEHQLAYRDTEEFHQKDLAVRLAGYGEKKETVPISDEEYKRRFNVMLQLAEQKAQQEAAQRPPTEKDVVEELE